MPQAYIVDAIRTPIGKKKGSLAAEHPAEAVGARLREMMPWIAEGRLVDKSKN